MSRQQRRYSGRTSIMNLVGTRALEQGIEDANILARLPSIARLEEDHNGASRLLGTLCYMYGFREGSGRQPGRAAAVPTGLEADRAEPRAQVLPQGAGGDLRFLGCLGGDKTAGAAVLHAAGAGTAPGRLGRAALGQPPSSTCAEEASAEEVSFRRHRDVGGLHYPFFVSLTPDDHLLTDFEVLRGALAEHLYAGVFAQSCLQRALRRIYGDYVAVDALYVAGQGPCRQFAPAEWKLTVQCKPSALAELLAELLNLLRGNLLGDLPELSEV